MALKPKFNRQANVSNEVVQITSDTVLQTLSLEEFTEYFFNFNGDGVPFKDKKEYDDFWKELNTVILVPSGCPAINVASFDKTIQEKKETLISSLNSISDETLKLKTLTFVSAYRNFGFAGNYVVRANGEIKTSRTTMVEGKEVVSPVSYITAQIKVKHQEQEFFVSVLSDIKPNEKVTVFCGAYYHKPSNSVRFGFQAQLF